MKWNRNNLISDLPKLLDEIHDNYFWISDIDYDQNRGEVVLHLSEKKKGKFDKILKIKGVIKYEIEDTEQIGNNSINTIHFDEGTNLITIDCNVPMKLEISLRTDFEILTEQ